MKIFIIFDVLIFQSMFYKNGYMQIYRKIHRFAKNCINADLPQKLLSIIFFLGNYLGMSNSLSMELCWRGKSSLGLKRISIRSIALFSKRFTDATTFK